MEESFSGSGASGALSGSEEEFTDADEDAGSDLTAPEPAEFVDPQVQVQPSPSIDSFSLGSGGPAPTVDVVPFDDPDPEPEPQPKRKKEEEKAAEPESDEEEGGDVPPYTIDWILRKIRQEYLFGNVRGTPLRQQLDIILEKHGFHTKAIPEKIFDFLIGNHTFSRWNEFVDQLDAVFFQGEQKGIDVKILLTFFPLKSKNILRRP